MDLIPHPLQALSDAGDKTKAYAIRRGPLCPPGGLRLCKAFIHQKPLALDSLGFGHCLGFSVMAGGVTSFYNCTRGLLGARMGEWRPSLGLWVGRLWQG